MKKLNFLFLMLMGTSVMFTSCSDDDPNPNPGPDPEDEFVLNANITEDRTLESGNVYTLASRVSVLDGVTLTIEPGVIIKGEAGSGANATALVIARGAKIDAQGTAESPIIFTSIADEIVPGEIYHEDGLSPEQNGLWGGLLILGKARVSLPGDNTEAQIEGIPPSDTNGLYGGNDDEDDSGILKYVSIRHGGANIGDGNEINGLTLGGVGSETVIENVEIIGNQDDGIEWFGGTVSVTNAVVWNAGDDSIDADQAWNGTLNNFIIVNGGDKCFELDGPEGSYVNGNYTLTNGSIIANGAVGLVDNDANTNVDMSNIYFTSVASGQTFDELPTVAAAFSNFEVTLPEGVMVSDAFLGGSAAFTTAVAEGENTVGADKSAFAGWTWAAASGALDILK
ncbi:right-handed parallel beta-helix repeat-containing protein [Echinicola sp. 20G]|uniref:right-handed parallel beta-helix repeat-containing protein n=1 Tax=Echinicola sp. 20G TaxID=2781961 RepID=UPI001F3A3EC6|nr:right-handed parallel beta-helix repeat-containing protein [Echinicola sp. 20G]